MSYKIAVMARNSTGRGLFLILILQPFFSLATLARSGWRYCQQMRRVKQPAKLRADSAILSWWTILEHFMMMERCSDNLEIRMDLAFWLLLSWMVVLVCLAKGIRTSGKVFQVPLNLIFPSCAHHANFNVSFLLQGGLLHCHLPLPHSTHPADNVSHPAWGC